MVLLHRESNYLEEELSPEEIQMIMEINRKLTEANTKLKETSQQLKRVEAFSSQFTTTMAMSHENIERRLSNLEKKLGYTWSPQPAPMKPLPTSDPVPVQPIIYPSKPDEWSVDVVMSTDEYDTKLVIDIEEDEKSMEKPVIELSSSVHLELVGNHQVYSESDNTYYVASLEKGLDDNGCLDNTSLEYVECGEDSNEKSKLESRFLISRRSHNFCNQGVRQNAYEVMNLFLPPVDFFQGLTSLEDMALDSWNLNGTDGWSLPVDLRDSAQLVNFTCNRCNMVGPLPEYLGSFQDLSVLMLSGNRISGSIPSSFNGSNLEMLWLNDQTGEGMSGTIDVVATMVSLKSLWLHGNHFTGVIPENIGDIAGLRDLNLNGNNLVGVVPDSLAGLSLDALDLNSNHLMGPIPKFAAKKVTYASNSFCQFDPGVPCDPQVMALLQFLGDLNYPRRIVSSWSGNDPCGADWVGVDCNPDHKVSSVSLPNFHLNGTLSPSVGKLNSLVQVRLESNNITGPIPANWTTLPSLTMLDLSGNNIIPPLPTFKKIVNLMVTGNPMLSDEKINTTVTQMNSSSPLNPVPSNEVPTRPDSNISNSSRESPGRNSFRISTVLVILIPITSALVLLCLFVPLSVFCYKKRRAAPLPATSLVVHPSDPLDPDNSVKIAVASSTNGHFSATSVGGSGSINNSRGGLHVIEAGNLVISVQVLRNVTNNFAPDNELGRGGFGVVYKGEFDDGTQIAVKRMESGVISNKALDEFHSEIAVLSKVRHRHLVSLLGYSVEGNERILVYEYMPQGALSRYLFHWKSMNLEPLSWKRRLNISLDVARGLEYLHSLAHQSFIHRDLKPSNILLGDDFRAKISDFGLVKLSPAGEEKSVVTRLAGTFGYLAPEYAVTGKITTKVDVFSFGVVLMELLTGMMALDNNRPEESQYLAAWFWQIKSDKDKLNAAIDPTLHIVEDMFPSIYAIAELAGHCTARDPNQRPDMGHAVNVLAPLVEKWKPYVGETEEYSGIDYSLPLNQMVKGWQESEGADFSYVDLDDSKSSIPARPTGFADSFTSSDGR